MMLMAEAVLTNDYCLVVVIINTIEMKWIKLSGSTRGGRATAAVAAQSKEKPSISAYFYANNNLFRS
jgi:hypothetical protein